MIGKQCPASRPTHHGLRTGGVGL